MTNDNISPESTTQPNHIENSTDATRGEPLAKRAQKRKAELEAALAKLPADEQRARNDIEVALGLFIALLTGDVDHLAGTTAADLNRLLENSKHLAEVVPAADVAATTSPEQPPALGLVPSPGA